MNQIHFNWLIFFVSAWSLDSFAMNPPSSILCTAPSGKVLYENRSPPAGTSVDYQRDNQGGIAATLIKVNLQTVAELTNASCVVERR